MRYIYSFLRNVQGKLYKWKKIIACCLPLGQKVYLVGTPLHNNIGDSAIVLASLKFLKDCYPKADRIKELTMYEYKYYGRPALRLCGNRNRVLGLGGGNMGDQWISEELFRRTFLAESIHCDPVILPQTIFYSDTENGRLEQNRSISCYNDPRVTIVARERKSYEQMQQLYSNAKLLLTPDIVLSTTAADYGVTPQDRCGILWCMRSDKEKAITPDFEKALLKCVESHHKPIRKTDMYTTQTVTKQNREQIVCQKMQEFAAAELVITDRLHGMIFAAITETPCIVFSNNHHKVLGTYEWLSHLPYIRFAENLADVETYLPELLETENRRFDNTPLLPYFDILKQVIMRNEA